MVASTRLETLIDSTCNSKNEDIRVALEICEIVKGKTNNAHRALTCLSKYFASLNLQQCLQSLFILDIMVINCGYPVHLCISKRDFLNKLVYRFPASPAHRMDEAHEKILYLIEKWTMTLCELSPHRSDFGNIRRLHCVLKSKDFTFPNVPLSDIQAICGTTDNEFRTKEEILEGERVVQEAKLEDLLRKGTHADLQAANELMKVMSGYDESGYCKADSTVAIHLRDLGNKRKLLEELLWNTDPSEYSSNDSIRELKNDLLQCLPKLENLLESELPAMLMEECLGLVHSINKLKEAFENTTSNTLRDEFSLISLNEDLVSNNETQAIHLSENPVIGIRKLFLFKSLYMVLEGYEVGEVTLILDNCAQIEFGSINKYSAISKTIDATINYKRAKILYTKNDGIEGKEEELMMMAE